MLCEADEAQQECSEDTRREALQLERKFVASAQRYSPSLQVLEKDVRRFFFQTRTFPALVQDAQRSRPKNMPWDTVDWIFAALMMAFVAYFLRAMV